MLKADVQRNISARLPKVTMLLLLCFFSSANALLGTAVPPDEQALPGTSARPTPLEMTGVSCKQASMAKLFASHFPVEKFYRDARVFQIYDGTNEVQKILISRELAAGR